MTIRSTRSQLRPLFTSLCATLALLSLGLALAPATHAQSTQAAIRPRITSPIDNTSRSVLAGSHSPQAIAANDAGAIPPATQFQGISLTFSRTPAQEADLQALIAAQQNPTSPLYHQWLSPTQFGARFGVADADIAAVQAWLTQQGFTLNSVSNSRDRITFSGTAAQVEAAFGAPIHYFKSAESNETHFAPASDLTLPAALASTVLSVSNLSDFRPKPHFTRPAKPDFTSATSGNHFLTPGDVATIYDVKAVYNAGYTGTGQTIAILGQSAVVSSDITTFQTAVGVTAKLPTLVLVPGTGTSTIYTGDESESDLDLEYSSTMAPGASIDFVYTGNSTNSDGVFTSLTYAIDNDLAPIISLSYGSCEPYLSSGFYNQTQAVLAQAAVQGQSVINSSGDSGSTGCYGLSGLTTAQEEILAVGYPVSSQYVTGVGGTEFPAAAVVAGNNTYFSAANGSDVVSSAISYIPEQAWNDDALGGGLSSGGGGISIDTPRPTWQTGVPGIPAGSYRLVPDIALDSSPNYAGYAYCTSDTTAWSTAANGASPPYQQNSCNSGLRDSYSNDLTIAGGTSFATPIFAGMLALINQAKGYSTGQGVINTTLYTLAATPATYASAFHDITSGSNECLASVAYCNTTTAAIYPATVGYDEATGLGSIDLNNLITAWPKSVNSGLTASITTVKAANASPALSAADVITITVASASATVTTVPTGTVAINVDGSLVNSALALTSGATTYTFASAVSGSHVITVSYSGDSHFAASTGTVSVTVGATSFTVAATNVSVVAGNNGTSTVTVTPSNGYTGTVAFTLNTYPTTVVLPNVCYSVSNLPITGVAATTTMTIATSSSACAALVQRGTGVKVSTLGPNPVSNPSAPWKSRAPATLALAGLAAVFCLRRRSRLLRASLSLGVLALLSISGATLTGCSNNSAATNVKATAGTYTLTLTGTDTVSPTITSSVNFTLTIM